MTISASAPISLADVMAELRVIAPTRAYPISLGDADVRALAGVPSGPVKLTNLLGKSSYIPMSGTLPNASDSAPISTTNYTAGVSVGITIAGGIGPFTYLWEHVSGSGSVVAVNAPITSAEFLVNRFAEPGTIETQLVRCTVTDSTGATLVRTCTATLTMT